LIALANLECEHGQFENALQLYRAVARDRGMERERALIAGNMAGVLAALGQSKRAEKLFRFALRLDQSAGNIGAAARHLQGLANLKYSAMAFSEAEQLLKEVADICHRTGDNRTLATAYGTLAEVLLAEAIYQTGEYDRALQVAEEAVSIADAQGSVAQVARYQISVARVLMMKGRFAEAAEIFEVCAVTFEELLVPHMKALSMEMLTECRRILAQIGNLAAD
jgi:tetratricopeptide (TPR) repeat protein